MLCLLIDDDIDDQEIFLLALEQVGSHIQCLTSSSAMQGLTLLENTHPRPNVIFLDLNMPMMNGLACLAEIKKRPSVCKIPVVIYSTSFDTRDIDETKRLGAAGFISKPSSIDELASTLKELFNQNSTNVIWDTQSLSSI